MEFFHAALVFPLVIRAGSLVNRYKISMDDLSGMDFRYSVSSFVSTKMTMSAMMAAG